MNSDEIIDKITELNTTLEEQGRDAASLSMEIAEAQRNYSVMCATKTLKYKALGESVTLIPRLVNGDEEVSNLRLKLDILKARYSACISASKNTRDIIGSLRSLLSWEREGKKWG